MTVTTQDLACTPQDARAAMIDWTAGLLAAPPDAEAVAHLRSAEGGALLDAIADELACGAAVDRMRAALRNGASPRDAALDLSVAYTRLFEGVIGPPAAPLYESAYAGGRGGTGGRLFGHAVDEMADLLQRFGVSVAGDCREPPDHASIELALFALLLRQGNEDGAAMLHARLCRWLPAFIESCREQDPQGFYGAVVTVLDALLGWPTLREAPPAAV